MLLEIIPVLINAFLLGGLYAIIGIGLSVMLGIMKVVNLAHGDLIILSSFFALTLVIFLGLSSFLTFFLVVPGLFFIGVVIQRYLLNRVLGRGMEPPLLVSFGLSVIIQNALLSIFTPDARSISSPLSVKTLPLAGFFSVPLIYVFAFIISISVIFSLYYIFQKTYLGWAIRAASDDEETAQLMGINTKNIYAQAMGLAMVTAAIAGILYGMIFTFYPTTGPECLIIAFGVVIIGGLGTIRGAFLGGIILALAQLLGAHFLGPTFYLLFGYLIIIIILAIRPQGLLRRG